MKKYKIKYSYCGHQMTGIKTILGSDSQDALNKFKKWSSDQPTSYDAIISVSESKPRINDSVFKDLGMIKVKGSVSGETYWE